MQTDNKFAKKSLEMMAEKMKALAEKYPEIGIRKPTRVSSLPLLH
jgi:hypothetical protein